MRPGLDQTGNRRICSQTCLSDKLLTALCGPVQAHEILMFIPEATSESSDDKGQDKQKDKRKIDIFFF